MLEQTRQEWQSKVTGRLDDLFRSSRSEWELRETHILEKGFPIVTQDVVDYLADLIGNDEVFEVGAGTGYLAALLSYQGVDIRAIDSKGGYCTQNEWWERPLHFNVEDFDQSDFDVFPGRWVVMSWPCYNSDFALQVSRKLQSGQYLIYQGEGEGGCTGTDEFFDCLREHYTLCREWSNDLRVLSHNFYGIHDRWMIYRRN